MMEQFREQLDRIEKASLLAAKNVFTVKDLALYLGKSEKTIRNNVDSIPHYRGGAGIVFLRSEIEEWQCQVKHNVISIQ